MHFSGYVEQVPRFQSRVQYYGFVKTSVNAVMNPETNVTNPGQLTLVETGPVTGMIFPTNPGRYESEIIRSSVNGAWIGESAKKIIVPCDYQPPESIYVTTKVN